MARCWPNYVFKLSRFGFFFFFFYRPASSFLPKRVHDTCSVIHSSVGLRRAFTTATPTRRQRRVYWGGGQTTSHTSSTTTTIIINNNNNNTHTHTPGRYAVKHTHHCVYFVGKDAYYSDGIYSLQPVVRLGYTWCIVTFLLFDTYFLRPETPSCAGCRKQTKTLPQQWTVGVGLPGTGRRKPDARAQTQFTLYRDCCYVTLSLFYLQIYEKWEI